MSMKTDPRDESTIRRGLHKPGEAAKQKGWLVLVAVEGTKVHARCSLNAGCKGLKDLVYELPEWAAKTSGACCRPCWLKTRGKFLNSLAATSVPRDLAPFR